MFRTIELELLEQKYDESGELRSLILKVTEDLYNHLSELKEEEINQLLFSRWNLPWFQKTHSCFYFKDLFISVDLDEEDEDYDEDYDGLRYVIEMFLQKPKDQREVA